MLTRLGMPHCRPVLPAQRWPRATTWAVLAVGGGAFAAVDQAIPGIGMGPAYIPLIALAGWRLGPLAACSVAAVAASLNVMPTLPGEATFSPAVAAARAALRLGTYAFVVVGTCTFRRAYDRERSAARRDGLTGVMNRSAFEEHAAAALAVPDGGCYVLVRADLNGFKIVNDAQGHAVGDEVLRGFAAAASSALTDGERIARFGGDEFVLLLRAGTEGAARARVAVVHRRLTQELSRHGVGVSMGAVALPAGSEVDHAAALRVVGPLMYAGKADGKGTISFGFLESPDPASPEPDAAGILVPACCVG